MADLKAKARNALPSSSFGEPGSRKYPMPDKAHAANAKSRAAQFASPGEKAKIDAKANKILGKGKAKAAMGTSDISKTPKGPIDPQTLSKMKGSLKEMK